MCDICPLLTVEGLKKQCHASVTHMSQDRSNLKLNVMMVGGFFVLFCFLAARTLSNQMRSQSCSPEAELLAEGLPVKSISELMI